MLFFEYGYKMAIPLNARHSNTLVHSFPLSDAGATRALGICKTINQMKSMAANSRLIIPWFEIYKNGEPGADQCHSGQIGPEQIARDPGGNQGPDKINIKEMVNTENNQ